MRKMLVIASREYQAAVRTKTFVIGLLMMPVLMGGSILLQWALRNQVDVREKRYAVIDRTPNGTLGKVLRAKVGEYNKAILDPHTEKPTKPPFVLEVIDPGKDGSEAAFNQQRFDLSERVRGGELAGFLEVLGPGSSPAAGRQVVLRYQTNRPTDEGFPRFAEEVTREAIQAKKLEKFSPEERKVLLQPVKVEPKGLSAKNAETGAIEEAPEQNRIASFAV